MPVQVKGIPGGGGFWDNPYQPPPPKPPGGGGGGAPAPAPAPVPNPQLPPEVTALNIQGTAPPELTKYSNDYQQLLKDIQAGRSREANVFREGLDSDIERQIAAAREQAASSGRPFNEAAVRAELTRGKNKSMAEFELGSQQQALGGMQGGLGIVQSPWAAGMAEKNFGLDTQKLLLNYALGRGGLANEQQRNQITQGAQAMQMYQSMLAMLANLSF